MSKVWIDPPFGWKYGFPKIWDKTTDPDLGKWLTKEGYPPHGELNMVRTWPVEEDEDGS